jgi:hypothetical protein
MPNTISKRDKTSKDKISGWDNVIADARRHIARLKAAIGHAEDMKKIGEPWPGSQPETSVSEQQHSV